MKILQRHRTKTKDGFHISRTIKPSSIDTLPLDALDNQYVIEIYNYEDLDGPYIQLIVYKNDKFICEFYPNNNLEDIKECIIDLFAELKRREHI